MPNFTNYIIQPKKWLVKYVNKYNLFEFKKGHFTRITSKMTVDLRLKGVKQRQPFVSVSVSVFKIAHLLV